MTLDNFIFHQLGQNMEINAPFRNWYNQASTQNEPDKVYLLKQFLLEMIGEVGDFLKDMDYKDHQKLPYQLSDSNLKEELIDIFKYWLSIALVLGIDGKGIEEEFLRKTEVVYQKYRQTNLVKAAEKVAIIDIDGVLADYPRCIMDYIHRKTGIAPMDIGTYDIYYEYGKVLGHAEVERLKHEFRESGEKRNIPVLPGALELLKGLNNRGYYIAILSSRPVSRYKRIMGDTLEWLNKNNLPYNGVLWDEEKDYKSIAKIPNVRFAVEDNLKFAINLAKYIDLVFLIDKKKYNQTQEDLPRNIIRVGELEDILLYNDVTR